jgi:sugar phosphate isomerase/epimerase
MRLALCNEVVRELDFPAQCALAGELGYDGVELAPFTLGDQPHRLPASTIARVRRAAADAGIAITGLHWLLLAPAGLSITRADEAVQARTRDVVERLIGLCAELGGGYLVHGSPAQRRLDPDDPSASRARAMRMFAAAAEAAERAGVVYCLEPLAPDDADFVTTVAEAARIVRALDQPAFRTMVDCSAAARGEAEPVADLLDHWLPTGLIAHVHLNDRNRRGPGEGEDRFAPVLATLRRHGWSGTLGVEPFVYEPDGPTCAARAAGYVRGILEALT